MRAVLGIVVPCLLAGGCALLGPREAGRGAEPQAADAAVDAAGPAEGAEAPGTAPQAPAARPEPAPALPATTVASLGDVGRPGLWLRTGLVTSPMRGRVRDEATGASVSLDLLPLDAPPGAGSRMSLAAYQALGLPLTALPELRVEPAG